MSKLATTWLYTKRLASLGASQLTKKRSSKELLEKYFNYRGKIDFTTPVSIDGRKFTAAFAAGKLFLLDKRWLHAYSQVIDCSDITDVECVKRLFGGQMTLKIGGKAYHLHHKSLDSLKSLEQLLWSSVHSKKPVHAIISHLKKLEDEIALSGVLAPRHRHDTFRY